MEVLLESLKAELRASREESGAFAHDLEEERANAARGWSAAREAGDGVERANARAEDAYGKARLLPVSVQIQATMASVVVKFSAQQASKHMHFVDRLPFDCLSALAVTVASMPFVARYVETSRVVSPSSAASVGCAGLMYNDITGVRDPCRVYAW